MLDLLGCWTDRRDRWPTRSIVSHESSRCACLYRTLLRTACLHNVDGHMHLPCGIIADPQFTASAAAALAPALTSAVRSSGVPSAVKAPIEYPPLPLRPPMRRHPVTAAAGSSSSEQWRTASLRSSPARAASAAVPASSADSALSSSVAAPATASTGVSATSPWRIKRAAAPSAGLNESGSMEHQRSGALLQRQPPTMTPDAPPAGVSAVTATAVVQPVSAQAGSVSHGNPSRPASQRKPWTRKAPGDAPGFHRPTTRPATGTPGTSAPQRPATVTTAAAAAATAASAAAQPALATPVSISEINPRAQQQQQRPQWRPRGGGGRGKAVPTGSGAANV